MGTANFPLNVVESVLGQLTASEVNKIQDTGDVTAILKS
jgi:hypothetical protein